MQIERVLSGDVLGPGDGVDVFVRPSPLKQERHAVRLPAGLSIAEIIDECHAAFPFSNRRRLFVTIGAHEIPAEFWSRVRVKPGVTVNIVAVPGKNAFKAILGLVVAVAALFLAPMIAVGLGFASTGMAASLIGAGISLAGSMVINALFPVAPQDNRIDKAKTLYSIGGSKNEAAQYGAIPVVFGRHRISPPYASGAYTELVGDDQYLRMLFVVGYGPMSISGIRIGETPIDRFDDVEYYVRENYITEPLTLYTRPVFEESVQILIDRASGWVSRSTADDISYLSIDLSFPQGLSWTSLKSGKKKKREVVIEVEYRQKGTSTWLPWTTFTIEEHTNDPIRRTLSKAVAAGQYDVRLRKTSEDYSGDNAVAEACYWTAIRGRQNAKAVNFNKPLTLIELKIKATGELSGTVDTLNCIAQPRIRSWNGTSWVSNQTTRNPADHFRHVLQGDANARPRSDSEIDLQSLQAWHAFCNQNGFPFEYVATEQRSVYEMLTMIAAAGRAAVSLRDGKWGVVWDVKNSPIVQHFTPRNSWGFSSQRAYVDMPHGFRVAFTNRDKGYLNDERVVYDDGYNAGNATKFEGIEFPGITDKDLVWKHGRYHIAQLRLQRETYTLMTDFEHLVCTRGDRVRVNHDAVLWGLGSARVKSVAGQTVTIDDTFTMEAGKTYSMRFRKADGSTLVRTIAGVAGEFSTVTLQGTGAVPAAGDLAMFGENGMESVILRVKSITPQADLTAQLELVDDAPEILDADTGPIPPFETGIADLIDYRAHAPTSLSVGRESVWTTDPPTSVVPLSWQAPDVGKVQGYVIEHREKGTTRWKRTNSVGPSVDITDLDDGSYDVRIRAIFDNGQLSGWLTGTFTAKLFAGVPSNVSGFVIAVAGDNATLKWSGATPTAIISHYEIRYSKAVSGVTWQNATVLRKEVTGTQVQVPAMRGTYLIKAVSHAGKQSSAPALIVSAIDPLTSLNAVELAEENAPFSGVKNLTHFDGARLRLDGASDFFSLSDVFSAGDWFLSSEGYAPEGYYDFTEVVDLGAVYTSRVSAQIGAYGEWSSDDFFALDDFFERDDFFGGIGGLWDVGVEVSTTNDDPVAVVTRASIGTYCDRFGVMRTAAADVPRWNYNPADLGAEPVLMAEATATNLVINSGELGNASWGKSNCPVVANVSVGPDGNMVMDKIVPNTTSGAHYIERAAGALSTDTTQIFTWSVYAKAAEYSQFWLQVFDSVTSNWIRCGFNLGTGAFSVVGAGGTATLSGYGMVHVGNGVYRCWITGKPAAANSGLLYGARIIAVNNAGSSSFAGNNSDGIYAWGAQLEVGSAPSSYIPTTTVAVTRATETIVSQPVWSDWEPLLTSDVAARGYRFRARLESLQQDITPVVNSMSVTVDMPDRVVAGNDLAVSAAGRTITFSPAFRKLQGLSIAAQGLATGDYYEITGKTEAGFTIVFKNAAGTAIARTLDYVAKGYGVLQ